MKVFLETENASNAELEGEGEPLLLMLLFAEKVTPALPAFRDSCCSSEETNASGGRTSTSSLLASSSKSSSSPNTRTDGVTCKSSINESSWRSAADDAVDHVLASYVVASGEEGERWVKSNFVGDLTAVLTGAASTKKLKEKEEE